MQSPTTTDTTGGHAYRTQRPDYPAGIVAFIREHCEVTREWRIADVGSGAGMSAGLLSRGLEMPVFAIEPVAHLRRLAEQKEIDNPYFRSLTGRAEDTGLPDGSVNLVSAFQSFQWFDRAAARQEFGRILRPPGWILMGFSDRVREGRGFSAAYEGILSAYPQYHAAMGHPVRSDDFERFLGNPEVVTRSFFAGLKTDWKGLVQRFGSARYTPDKGTPEYERALHQLKELFGRYQRDGRIEIRYETRIYLGALT